MTRFDSLIFATLLMSAAPMTRLVAQGPGSVVGTVVDSAGKPVEGVEVTVAEGRRRVYTRPDGSFRIDNVAAAVASVSVRRIGYLPQQRRVTLDSAATVVNFRLMPTAAVLPTLTTAASQLGLSGTVVDTAGRPVAGARVRVLATSHRVDTDSAGAFWMPVPSGSYMVAVAKDKFAQRLASVTIPADSGRSINVWLRPAVTIPVRQAWNVEDMRERLAFIPPQRRFFYTREMLEQKGITDIFDAVNRLSSRFDLRVPLNPECLVVIDGGPDFAVLSSLHTDQVESVEVYRVYPTNSATSRGARFNQRSNTEDARRGNVGISCIGVYVWLR
jgi:hypothetical protein